MREGGGEPGWGVRGGGRGLSPKRQIRGRAIWRTPVIRQRRPQKGNSILGRGSEPAMPKVPPTPRAPGNVRGPAARGPGRRASGHHSFPTELQTPTSKPREPGTRARCPQKSQFDYPALAVATQKPCQAAVRPPLPAAPRARLPKIVPPAGGPRRCGRPAHTGSPQNCGHAGHAGAGAR